MDPITANELLNDDGSTVDVTTGSCIYGQAAAGYAVGMNTTCAYTNLTSPNPDYECQCLTQADANGGEAAFAEMEKKASMTTNKPTSFFLGGASSYRLVVLTFALLMTSSASTGQVEEASP